MTFRAPRLPTLFLSVALAGICLLPVARAEETEAGIPLCAGAQEDQKNAPDMRSAVAAAFGLHPDYQSAPASGTQDGQDAPACQELTALLHFHDRDVLITAHTDGGAVGHVSSAYLSAYLLKPAGADGTLKLEAAIRDFDTGANGWGDAGTITPVQLGADDGMVVSGGYTSQGITADGASFYAFHAGGIIALGFLPLGVDNSGFAADPKDIVSVTGAFGDVLPTDRVPVTYTRVANGKTQTFTVVWHSAHGKFAVASGRAPPELIEQFGAEAFPAEATEATEATKSTEAAHPAP